jgi:zinc transporter
LIAQLAQQQNSRMYILSIVAAIFLPLSFLTGLMGMNVAGLPGTEDPASFTLLVILMLAVGFGIVGIFRWQKWL